jgi:hypothetical protein
MRNDPAGPNLTSCNPTTPQIDPIIDPDNPWRTSHDPLAILDGEPESSHRLLRLAAERRPWDRSTPSLAEEVSMSRAHAWKLVTQWGHPDRLRAWDLLRRCQAAPAAKASCGGRPLVGDSDRRPGTVVCSVSTGGSVASWSVQE